MVEVAARPAGARGHWALFAAVAAVILVSDQLSKRWVDASFGLAWTRAPGPGLVAPTPIAGDLVRIAKSYNDGGIFGLFGSSAPILALASLAVIGFILWYQARTAAGGPWLLTITLGLLLGGALGNLADRLRLGYVIDFVDVGLGSLRFYTFNVADSAISLAIVGLALVALLGDRLDGSEVLEPGA
ncbi:MAG: signal peptidase II [Candidatus Limnocylindrales bacterium]